MSRRSLSHFQDYSTECIYDEADQAYLNSLSALEREQILADRHTELQRKKDLETYTGTRGRVTPDALTIAAAVKQDLSKPKKPSSRPKYTTIDEDDDFLEPSDVDEERESDEEWAPDSQKSSKKAKAKALRELKSQKKSTRKTKTPRKPRRKGVNVDHLDSEDIFDEGGEEIGESEHDYPEDEDIDQEEDMSQSEDEIQGPTQLDRMGTELAKKNVLTTTSVEDNHHLDIDEMDVWRMVLYRNHLMTKLKFPNIDQLVKGFLVRLKEPPKDPLTDTDPPRYYLAPILRLNPELEQIIIPKDMSNLSQEREIGVKDISNSDPLKNLKKHTDYIPDYDAKEYLNKLKEVEGRLPSKSEVEQMIETFKSKTSYMSEVDVQERLKNKKVKTKYDLVRDLIESKRRVEGMKDDNVDVYLAQHAKAKKTEQELAKKVSASSSDYALEDISKKNRYLNKMAVIDGKRALKQNQSNVLRRASGGDVKRKKLDESEKEELKKDFGRRAQDIDCDDVMKDWIVDVMVKDKVRSVESNGHGHRDSVSDAGLVEKIKCDWAQSRKDHTNDQMLSAMLSLPGIASRAMCNSQFVKQYTARPSDGNVITLSDYRAALDDRG
ncbi:hypothetical protein GEMRC1_003541 [Eukaryota sp. GEM-RC1]